MRWVRQQTILLGIARVWTIFQQFFSIYVIFVLYIVIYEQPVISKAKVRDEIHDQNSYTEAVSEEQYSDFLILLTAHGNRD